MPIAGSAANVQRHSKQRARAVATLPMRTEWTLTPNSSERAATTRRAWLASSRGDPCAPASVHVHNRREDGVFGVRGRSILGHQLWGRPLLAPLPHFERPECAGQAPHLPLGLRSQRSGFQHQRQRIHLRGLGPAKRSLRALHLGSACQDPRAWRTVQWRGKGRGNRVGGDNEAPRCGSTHKEGVRFVVLCECFRQTFTGQGLARRLRNDSNEHSKAGE